MEWRTNLERLSLPQSLFCVESIEVNYEADALCPINLAAFRPHPKNDADGLSFFRESLIDAKSVAESARNPAEYYVVARLSVAELNRLGLTVVESEIPDLPGHCHIPELAASIYHQDKASKNRYKVILSKAGRSRIE
jgi:hypothetical protein